MGTIQLYGHRFFNDFFLVIKSTCKFTGVCFFFQMTFACSTCYLIEVDSSSYLSLGSLDFVF